ncbi:monocarboxylate transporter 12-like [Ischnura elegans]|uniref:monocarboxylate transporter 12-like n=1 Tax=Ischnura elegans TaxID=197161 RepID=UPI001ED870EA|nr:monocarboxylate transporter 12-like [Ischnura elegans]
MQSRQCDAGPSGASWADEQYMESLRNARRGNRLRGSGAGVVSGVSFSESSDSGPQGCPQCRCRNSECLLRRHDSAQSARSAQSASTTLNTYVSSSCVKDPRILRIDSRLARNGGRDQCYPYGGPEAGVEGEEEDEEEEEEGRHYDPAAGDVVGGGVGEVESILNEREMNSLHKTVPALRRHDVKTSTIRQHYYPEGGWGWIVCGCGFLVHLLTTGLQFSYGVLYLEVVKRFGEGAVMDAAWIGVLCFAVSLVSAPLVVALCRRKSTRLAAVFGGLVMSLACLFTSFAHQVHQIFLSYGVVLGIGTCLVRETSGLMLGHYFKRRREFVEIVVQAGGGIGVTLFSVFYKEVLGTIGWRLGLQAVTGVLFVSFFIGIFYRSASLYHPQRRAILHLKNQKKKVKEKKGHVSIEKPPFFDFSPLKIRAVQVLLLSSATSAVGLYTPIFYLVLQGYREGLEDSALLLLQTFLGFATALGCVGFGLVVVRPSDQCLISRQYLCQAAMIGIGISLLALSTVQGYHGYVLFVWIYGIFLGGFLYALKMYTFERVRARHFTRTWSFVQGAEAIPVLLGIPITGYINQGNPKAGYYFSSFFAILGAALLFLMNWYKRGGHPSHQHHRGSHGHPDASVSSATIESHISGGGTMGGMPGAVPYVGGPMEPTGCTCPPPPPSISFATTLDLADDEEDEEEPAPRPATSELMVGCISEEGLADNYVIDYDFFGGNAAPMTRGAAASMASMGGEGPYNRYYYGGGGSHRMVGMPDRALSRSEPEALCHAGSRMAPHQMPIARLPPPALACSRRPCWHRRPVRNIMVIEQMTTSV